LLNSRFEHRLNKGGIMRLSVVGFAAGLALLLTGTAHAADQLIPMKARTVVPLAWTWDGFYIGAHLGAGWSESRTDAVTDVVFPGFILAGPLLVPSRFGTVPGVTASDTNLLGGGQVGYNWQYNALVFGLEGDFSVTQLGNDVTFGVLTAPPGFEAGQILTGSYSTEVDWMASVRARLGWAWDRLLIYATGGVAFAEMNVNSGFTLVNTNGGILFPAASSGTTAASSSFTKVGWTVGGGIEWAFSNNWSFAAEYRHSDFGSERIALAATDPSGALLLPALTTNVRLTVDQATVRANYRFYVPGRYRDSLLRQ
jgi:outer membrane immunogenic protein